MKYIMLSLFLIFGFATSVWSQQIALNTQYLFNNMLVNPGATGTKNYIPVQLNFRKQWTNFPGSPTTQFLSCDSKLADNFGICLLYTSPSPRDVEESRMPSSA